MILMEVTKMTIVKFSVKIEWEWLAVKEQLPQSKDLFTKNLTAKAEGKPQKVKNV